MQTYNNWEKFYQKLNLIFHGIIASSLIPFAWVFLETQKEFPEGPLIQGTMLIIVKTIVVVISAVALAYSRIYRKQLVRKVGAGDNIEEKLKAYLNFKVIHFAIIELAAVMALIGLYLSKDQLFTVIYIIALFIFSLERPAFDRVAREIGEKPKDLQDWANDTPEKQ